MVELRELELPDVVCRLGARIHRDEFAIPYLECAMLGACAYRASPILRPS